MIHHSVFVNVLTHWFDGHEQQVAQHSIAQFFKKTFSTNFSKIIEKFVESL